MSEAKGVAWAFMGLDPGGEDEDNLVEVCGTPLRALGYGNGPNVVRINGAGEPASADASRVIREFVIGLAEGVVHLAGEFEAKCREAIKLARAALRDGDESSQPLSAIIEALESAAPEIGPESTSVSDQAAGAISAVCVACNLEEPPWGADLVSDSVIVAELGEALDENCEQADAIRLRHNAKLEAMLNDLLAKQSANAATTPARQAV